MYFVSECIAMQVILSKRGTGFQLKIVNASLVFMNKCLRPIFKEHLHTGHSV